MVVECSSLPQTAVNVMTLLSFAKSLFTSNASPGWYKFLFNSHPRNFFFEVVVAFLATVALAPPA